MRARIKLFMALSRTPHGVLDMVTPALAALILLGSVPPFPITLLGLLTAFAGYTAVYALNDVVDYRTDKEKLHECGELRCVSGDLDAVYPRHPMAQGLLSLKEGLIWTGAWGGIALAGAYMLNPACALVFVLGCVAEGVYCLMLRLSYLRVVISGGVKTAGGIAAVFAVVPNPSALFVVGLFLWLFFWEIGGQNIPNDWTDLDEDRRLDAVTLPVKLGADRAAAIIFGSLIGSVVISLLLFWITPAVLHPVYLAGALAAGTYLLLIPAYRLYGHRAAPMASALFNRACYYPVTMLFVVLLGMLLRS